MLPRPESPEDNAARRDRAAEPVRAPRGAPPPVVPPRGDNNWLASSFDLAQGLDVKEMVSKLPRETLDQLFRS